MNEKLNSRPSSTSGDDFILRLSKRHSNPIRQSFRADIERCDEELNVRRRVRLGSFRRVFPLNRRRRRRRRRVLSRAFHAMRCDAGRIFAFVRIASPPGVRSFVRPSGRRAMKRRCVHHVFNFNFENQALLRWKRWWVIKLQAEARATVVYMRLRRQ